MSFEGMNWELYFSSLSEKAIEDIFCQLKEPTYKKLIKVLDKVGFLSRRHYPTKAQIQDYHLDYSGYEYDEQPELLPTEEEINLAQGKNSFIESIKRYRGRTNAGLAEAKRMMDKYRKSPASSFGFSGYSNPTKAEIELVQNNFIQAVKSYNDRTKCGLKIAKETMEPYKQYQREPNQKQQFYSPNTLEKDLARSPKPGDFFLAIKTYRERTGVGLGTAKNALKEHRYHR